PNLHAQDLLDRPRDHLVTATVGEALGLVRAGETEQDGVAVDPDRADITAGEHHPGESTSVLHRFQDLVPGALEAPQVHRTTRSGGCCTLGGYRPLRGFGASGGLRGRTRRCRPGSAV